MCYCILAILSHESRPDSALKLKNLLTDKLQLEYLIKTIARHYSEQKCPYLHFLYPATQKVAGYYVIPSEL